MNDTDILFAEENRFGACECAHLPHRIVVTKCGLHHLKVNGFFQRYFASVTCGCRFQEKSKTCTHCDRLEIALNVNVLKVCMKEEDFPKRFKFYDFSDYAKALPGDPFFVYDEELNCLVKRIDSYDWRIFFIGRETM